MNLSGHWIDPVAAAEIEAAGTTAFRLCTGGSFSVERFGDSALISARTREDIRILAGNLQAWSAGAAWIPARTFARLLVRGPGGSDVPALIAGDGAAPQVVRENGLLYEVDFSLGYSPGLFCDQRANRLFLKNLGPRRVLNTFAHTCAFSVSAAASGAETVSVDISKSALERGRRNFALNNFDPSGHRFIVEDVAAYLARLIRRGEAFDAIILDPPTFGRGGGRRTFRIERDFETLFRAALAVCAPGAAVLLSTNYAAWDAGHLKSLARTLLPRHARLHVEPPQPDFPKRSPSVWVMLNG